MPIRQMNHPSAVEQSRNRSAARPYELVGFAPSSGKLRSGKAGDLKAAEHLLARIWPPRRGRNVRIELAPIQSAAGVSEAMAAVLDAMAAGDITPDEAATIAAILEVRRKAIETQELAERITRLEQQTGSR